MSIQRYQRHSLIDWFDQDLVKAARVIVVGAGAVGNEVLKNLALLGVGHLHIIDFDTIEEHNLTRSVLFRETDIGRAKAEAAALACRALNPNIEVRFSSTDYWEVLTLKELSAATAVFNCTDNFESRIKLNRLCLLTATDYYNTAVDSRYVSVEVFPFSSAPDCGCYECTLPPSVYSSIRQRYSCGFLKKVAHEERKIPTTVVTSTLAASLAVGTMLNRLNRHADAPVEAVRYFADTITLSSTVSTIRRNGNCFVCSSVDPSVALFSARRWRSSEDLWPLARHVDAGRVRVRLSEPVLIETRCGLCGRVQRYFESARRLTDALTFCSFCGTQSNETHFAEYVSLEEFQTLFHGESVPCKYLVIEDGLKQTIVEMED